ncbi:uncharacterized protein LOC121869154 [Homarus americanus]|uniref:uncharacterized protein LOC121869154 n=1 Tax=Homarus americanus TaxID=6706 RepID=UPI001C45C0E0|nr:uncharacterized protein LOC121869154 [Homarus americanus]
MAWRGGNGGGGCSCSDLSSSRSSSRRGLLADSGSEPSTPTHRVVTFVNNTSTSFESPTPSHRAVTSLQGLTESRRPSSNNFTAITAFGKKTSLMEALENSKLRRRSLYKRRASLRRPEPPQVSVWRSCLPCTAPPGYSGIPLLVRQRSNGAGGAMVGASRGRRNSTVGGPRRQLSRRVSRRESRRGSKSRRRSSVHPPVHIPNKDGEPSEDDKEEKPKNPIRRLSRMLSNAGPALVRRVSKLRRKSLALVEGGKIWQPI